MHPSVFLQPGLLASARMDAQKPQHMTRLAGYDFMRLIATVAVISIHVLMVSRGDGNASAMLPALFDRSLHFAVPLFFFVSGALIWGRYRNDTPVAFARFMGGRASRVLLPYLGWSVLYLAISALRGDAARVVGRAPELLLWGKAWYHLYFVPAIMLLYALTPVIAPAARRQPATVFAATVIVRALAAVLLYGPVKNLGDPLFYTLFVAVTTHLPDVALGAWFALRIDVARPRIERWWLGLLGAGTILVTLPALLSGLPRGISYASPPLGMALDTLGIAGLAFRIRVDDRGKRTVAALSDLTYGVYLGHPMLVLAWTVATQALGLGRLWGYSWFLVTEIAAVSAISFLITAVLARTRHGAWLVGLRARSNQEAMPG